jgi:hypothetical protein
MKKWLILALGSVVSVLLAAVCYSVAMMNVSFYAASDEVRYHSASNAWGIAFWILLLSGAVLAISAARAKR